MLKIRGKFTERFAVAEINRLLRDMTEKLQALYHRIGHAITAMPNLDQYPFSREVLDWIAEINALMEVTGDIMTWSEVKVLTDKLHHTTYNPEAIPAKIYVALKRVMFSLEMKMPIKTQGTFILTGNAYDAIIGIGKILKQATKDILIVDPYMNELFVNDFAGLAQENVPIRLLSADTHTLKKANNLKSTAARWTAQYTSRPLEARVAPAKVLHDRLIFLDGTDAYQSGQSFKDLAAKSPTSLVRVPAEIALEKIASYETVWKAAVPL